MRKGNDPDPYLWLTDPDADPGGPKWQKHTDLDPEANTGGDYVNKNFTVQVRRAFDIVFSCIF
jgi:hypothetical protein